MNRAARRFFLAGASVLAILAGAAEANSESITGPGSVVFTAPATGEYVFEVLGAAGGSTALGSGGAGAEVTGYVSLSVGQEVLLFGGGQGGSGSGLGGGGGGLSLIESVDFLAVAGGGGGAGSSGGNGGPGQAVSSGQAGFGTNGGAGGMAYDGGQGGNYSAGDNGGGGAGIIYAGYTGAGPNSGFGSPGYLGGAPNGGLGAGGGSGASGGYGGGGGGSAAYGVQNAFFLRGVNDGEGFASINEIPEPSTWAMTLTGFAGLGWLARKRKRKLAPA